MLPFKRLESIILNPKESYRRLTFAIKIYSHNVCTVVKKENASIEKFKDVTGPYPSAYEPADVEKKWYEWWEENELFKPESSFSGRNQQNELKPVFSMVLPPPNITGNLHLGHTLTVAIQDAIARWHRMNGRPVMWIPGYDHGGIATQAIIEKKLAKEKRLSKHEVGKENFLMEIKQWKAVTEKNIEEQLKKLGASLDFTRATFTMDSNTSEAVTSAFIQLYEENLIYRKEAIVNWSCAIKSVISDIEVEHIEVPGSTKLRIPGLPDPVEVGILDFFYYPLFDTNEKLLVATTRLETMLGDSAVAVHPNDSRYAHLIGKYVSHPFTGKKLPIIADDSINKDFGSGVMKVTPGHDAKDFALGEKNCLPINNILDDDGTIKEHIDIFGGMHRFTARNLVRDHLIQRGLYLEKKSHPMSVPLCSRTGDIIEPRIKCQWYLNCSILAAEAIKAVEEGRVKLIPDYHVKIWSEWFKNLKDWCISRQLWWGHPIPMYKVKNTSDIKDTDFWVAAKNYNDAISTASKKLNVDPRTISVVQDGDVLDTWFSSALFPLTSLGWPSKVDDMNKFYPLSLMETGYDILFFWVARMIMLGHHFTGKLPFNEVLLHGMVCDSLGRKMTKSLGNIIDPLDIIQGISIENLCQRAKESHRQGILSADELKLAINSYRRSYPVGIPECGTDGLRFSLLSHDVQSQRINVDVKEIRVCRHLCNKIWQGIRFFTKATENCSPELLITLLPGKVTVTDFSEVDQWILSRLSRVISTCNQSFENYSFHIATTALRQFWVKNFCDIYLEYVKSVLSSGNKDKQVLVCQIMLTCIENFIRCISPFMPYLSEELYQRLSHMTNIERLMSVTVSSYPSPNLYSAWRNTVLEADIHTAVDIVNVARSLKTQHGATKIKPKVTIAAEAENTLCSLNRFSSFIANLARLESVTFHLTQGQEFFEHHPQDLWVFQMHDHGITVIMEGPDHEAQPDTGKAVEVKVDNVRQELIKLTKMVSDSGYRKNAPLSVQEKHLAKKASLEEELQKLLTSCGKIESERKEDSSSS